MTTNEVEALLLKYTEGKCTPEEKQLVETRFLQYLENKNELPSAARIGRADREMFANIQQHLNEGSSNTTIRLWPRIAAAASVIIALSAGGYFILHKTNNQQLAQVQQDVNPGGNKAILVLANGRQLNITNAVNGRIASQHGAVIQKTANGEIVYQSNQESAPEIEELNTIKTPKGGKWNLTLADGTKVWLNAASSITYPAKFIGSERKISITGEAYFEVAHNDAHPFKVEFNGQTVQDIGTHFNINTYADEPVSKTTLLEGSIKITLANGNNKILKPGHVAIVNNNKLSTEEADEEEAIAWKSGNLIAHDEPLTGIMRKVARQYDVDIVYKDDVSDITMGCAVTTTKKLSTVLNQIRKTEKHIDFKIDGRTVTVFKKNP